MAVTATQLNQLYLAYFGRPVDFGGYTFFTTDANSTVASVSASFAASAESKALYGTDPVTMVNAIYNNLFNRDADLAGLNYWVGLIQTGKMTAPQAALSILQGAQGSDADCIANKLAVSQLFFNHIDTGAEAAGYTGAAAASVARAYIHTVDSTTASVTNATAVVDTTIINVVSASSTTPAYWVTQSANSVAEGGFETFTINTANVAAGTTLGYTLTGTGDASSLTGTGNVTIDSSGHAAVTVQVPSNTVLGDSGTLQLSLLNGQASSATVSVTDATPVPTYTVIASAATIAEGTSETFTVATTNLAAGTSIGYTITGTGNAAGQSSTGTLSIDATGHASVTVAVPTNSTVGDSGTLQFTLNNAQSTSTTVNVTDATVVAPTYSVATSAASVAEGATETFTINASNVADGTVIGYKITGTGSATGASATGSATVTNGTATVVVTAPTNNIVGDSGSLQLVLTNGQASSSVVQVTDATAPAYTLSSSAASVAEGQTVTFSLQTNLASGTFVGYTVAGTNDAAGLTGSGSFTVDASGKASVTFTLPANMNVNDAGTLTLTLLTDTTKTTSVNVTDATPTTFTVDATTIVTANASNSPVVVTLPNGMTAGQSATVTIQSTDATLDGKGIVIQGNGDATVNMGSTTAAKAGVETIYVGGTGNTTINMGASADSLALGTGSDKIVIDGSTTAYALTAGQTLNAGTGTDTLDLTGAVNLTAGALAGIEDMTIHTGTATVTSAEAAAFTSIAGAAGATAKLAIVVGANTDLSGKLSGLNTLSLTGVGAITVTAADLTGLTTVTTGAGTSIVTTVAGALALLAINPAVTYSISDTAANLASAPASVFQGANLAGVSQAGATALTVAQAVTVWTNNHNATFTVSDTAANLYNAVVYDGNAAVLRLATAPNATVQVTGTATAQQAGVLKGLAHATFAVSDSIAHLNTGGLTAQLGAFTTVVTALTLTGNATAAQANAIATYAGTHVAGLVVSDTAVNVGGLGATAIADATSIHITGVNNVAGITGLSAAITAKLASGYALSDTAAALIAASLVSNAAGNITATDASIGVAVATQLETLSNSGTKAFVLTDTAVNLAGASAAVLHDATAVNVQGNVTVAQAAAIVSSAVPSYHLVDTAANIIGASAAVIAKGLAGGGSIAISDANVSLATAAQVYAVSNTIAFNISDSASVIAAVTSAVGYGTSNSKTVLDHATAVTLTGTGSVAQADSIYAANIGGAHHGSSTLAVSDTVANIVAAAADVAVTGSASIHATGTATVANVVTLLGLAKFDGQYAISDSATNIANAINAATLTDVQLNASTAPVVLTGTVDVVHAGFLHADVAFTNWNGQYNIVDSVANLQGAAAALLTSAASVKVLDTVGNVNGNYPWITTHTSGYSLNDTAANLLGNAIVVGSAQQATVNSGAVTAATAKALNAENSGKVVYDIADTAANLSGANLTTNQTGVANAKTVTVTDVGGTTVAVVAAIKAANATAGLTYSLADTAANLIANTALTTGATAVTVNDASVSAAVAAQVLAIRAAAFTAISDTAANIAAAAAATIDAAGTVKVTDHDRVTLNTTEIAHFGEVAGQVTGFTSTAGGLGGAAPMYNLADTAANLVALFGVTPGSLTDAGKVTFVAGGAAQTAANIQAIITAVTAAKVSGSYALSDTVANLIAGANNAAVKGAASVAATGTANAADATTLYGLNAAASYTVTDTAATVAAGGNGVAHATTITLTTDATVAQLVATHAANAGAAINYALADTAANLAAATSAQLSGAVMLTVNTAATVAQMNAIDTNSGHNQAMNVVDTAANLSAASATELAVVTGVVATGTASAAQGALLSGKTIAGAVHVQYAVSDTATAIAANPTAIGVNTTAVTVTTGATVAEAVTLSALTFGGGATHLTYGIADTAANLLSVDTIGQWNLNANVTVTDNVDVATAERVYAINNNAKFNVVDTEANIAAALNQTLNTGAAQIDLNNMLGQAQSVTVSGVGVIKLVGPIGVNGDYVVSGTVAELNALPADLKAHGYAVNDTVANIVANYGYVAAGTGGKYAITDTGANIAAAATTLVTGAAKVTVTGATDAATATTIYGANNAAVYSVSDTAANLAAGANATGVQHGTAVTATTAATAAQGLTIYTANNAASYTVTDTVANVTAGGNGVIHASAITMTGNATVAQLGVAQGLNAHVTVYSLSDTAANLAAATAAQLAGATAVAATTAATGAQAATIYASAPAATYAINDTVVANLFTGDTLKASTTHATSIAGAVAAADVAQATALNGLGAQFTGSYTITDAAALVAGAAQTVLDKATAVAMTGTVDAAHATTIAGETFSGAHTALTGLNGAAEKDVSASILAVANAAGLAGANSVEATDTLSVATATSVYNGATYAKGVAGHVVFDQISDTSTNLQLGTAAVVNDATHINVTNSVNMGLAQFVENNVGTAGAANYTFAQISDTAANVLADTATAGRATSITLTGTATVATAEQLITSSIYSKVSGGYAEKDTAANILTAFWDQDHAAAVTGASSLTVSNNANVSQATVLESMANVAASSVNIEDTLANVNAASAGTKNLAKSLTVDVNDAGAGVYSDTGLTPASHLVYSHTGAFDADPGAATVLLNGANTNQWTSANFDVLTLKSADTIDLSAYTLNQQAVTNTVADQTVADNTYELIRGDVSNGGQTFTQDAAGNSLLVLWDADATGASVHETGVILVGATSFTSTDTTTVGATHPIFHV